MKKRVYRLFLLYRVINIIEMHYQKTYRKTVAFFLAVVQISWWRSFSSLKLYASRTVKCVPRSLRRWLIFIAAQRTQPPKTDGTHLRSPSGCFPQTGFSARLSSSASFFEHLSVLQSCKISKVTQLYLRFNQIRKVVERLYLDFSIR